MDLTFKLLLVNVLVFLENLIDYRINLALYALLDFLLYRILDQNVILDLFIMMEIENQAIVPSKVVNFSQGKQDIQSAHLEYGL